MNSWCDIFYCSPTTLALKEGTPKKLLNFSKQVGLGLHYLSSKGFVHRDLAARNILVSKNNIVKVILYKTDIE